MPGQAYRLPVNLVPDDDFCAKVFIPNSDEYRRAFLGAYTAFGTWVVWQRDNAHSAATAAERWRESISRTLDLWGKGCDCDMTEDEILDLIRQELEAMTITINNIQNCGCCGDGSSSNTTIGDGITPPDDYTLPPVIVPEPDNYLDNVSRCNRANYILVQYRTACLTIYQKVGSYLDFSTWFTDVIYAAFGVALPTYDWYIKVLAWASSGLDQDTFTSQFDQNFDAMVCALYSASSAETGASAVESILDEYVMPGVDSILRLLFIDFWRHSPVDVVYDADAIVDLPPGFSSRECCGGVPVDNVLGLWIPDNVSGMPVGYCQVTEIGINLDNQNQFDADVILSKTQSTTSYAFSVKRDTPFADATYFNITLNLSGDIGGWTVIFYDAQENEVYETANSGAPQQPYAFTNGVEFDFTSVTGVRVRRQDELYNATCPRNFSVAFEISTDSQDWLVY